MYLASEDSYYQSLDLNKVMSHLEQLLHVDRQTILTNLEYFFLTWNKMMVKSRHIAAGNPPIDCEISSFNSFIFCTLYMMTYTIVHNKRFMERIDYLFRLSKGGQHSHTQRGYSVRFAHSASHQDSSSLTQQKGRELVLLDAILLSQHIIYIFDFMDLVRFSQVILYNPTYNIKSTRVANKCAMYLEELVIQIYTHDSNRVIYAPLHDPAYIRAFMPAKQFAMSVPRPVANGNISGRR